MSKEPLTDGSFRRLWPSDRADYADHLKRLSTEDRRLRFLSSVSDQLIDRHAERLADPTYFACGWFRDGALCGVVEVATGGEDAEAALSVEQAWRNRGIGRTLLGLALRRTRLIGESRLRILTSRTNRPMLRIARAFGAEFFDLQGEVVGIMAAGHGTITELLFDATENQTGLMVNSLGLFDLSMRGLLGPASPRPA